MFSPSSQRRRRPINAGRRSCHESWLQPEHGAFSDSDVKQHGSDRPELPLHGDDRGGRVCAFPRHEVPELCTNDVPRRERGRRECRVLCCTRSLVCEVKKHTSKSLQVKPNKRHSLRDGVNAYFRALPGVRDVLVTVACGIPSDPPGSTSPIRKLSASPGAPEPHDFVVRDLPRSSHALSRPSHPAPRFVTIGRSAPLVGAGRRERCR